MQAKRPGDVEPPTGCGNGDGEVAGASDAFVRLPAVGRSRDRRCLLSGLVAVGIVLLLPAAAAALPPGYSDRAVAGDLKTPTSLAIAPDGRIFVTEKRGTVMSFDRPGDATPTLVADLRTEVHDFYERGLLSIALDPGFPRRPYAYVGYTYDAPIGGTAPTWGRPGGEDDPCLPGDPDPSYEQGCPVSSRVSQLTIGPDGTATGERVLLNDWCQQFPSHSIGSLVFDRRGALLVGGGEGAYFGGTDTGQRGSDPGVCGDPAGEGGALRAQDLRTAGDPVTLDGTIARIDPDTGAPAAGNPTSGSDNAGRILSYGLRNPFRFTLRPDTDELWIGDVGWGAAEEIDTTTIDRPHNFGWPCFEGDSGSAYLGAASSPICNALAADPAASTKPWFSYLHGKVIRKGEPCDSAAGAISGIAFDEGRGLPQPYDGALFFADYTRGCIWSFRAGRDGRPRPKSVKVFESGVFPVELSGARGALYYPDLITGEVHRISYDRPTVEVRLQSKPAGAALGVDARIGEGRLSVTVAKRSRHRLSAPRRLRINGRTLRFARWSDGGARRHNVKPRRSSKVTAIYRRR